MRSIKGLIVAMAGVAMLAVPITASAANSYRAARDGARYTARVQRSFNSHNFTSNRTFAPRASAERNFARSTAGWANRNFAERDRIDHDGGAHGAYQSYGYVPPAPVYAAPAPALGYAAPYNACSEAQRAINIARHDRNTGHPAAARDVLRNHSRALAACPQAGGLAAYGKYGYGSPAYPYSYGASPLIAPLLQNFIR